MTTLRPYQSNAIESVFAKWNEGKRSICLVAPTGAGKTVMLSAIVERSGRRTLWLAHRKELIGQAADPLERLGLSVGVIAPGFPSLPDRQVQIASWQTLLGRERPDADLVVIDECHHGPAEEWRAVIDHYGHQPRLGATATPDRGDGKPMGDVFDDIVVAANYSELVRDGHLVPCRVFRPDEELHDGIAKGPLEAYEKSPAKGLPGIGFASLRDCERFAESFTRAGYKSEVLSGSMASGRRKKIIAAYRNGELAFLWSMHILTEGFDAPHATVCILAGTCGNTGQFIQRVGRVLRPSPGKDFAFLLDLRGVSHKHGLPTEDRVYSLDGKPISAIGALKVCADCGLTYEPEGDGACPSCGFKREPLPRVEPAGPVIHDRELAEVYAGSSTPSDAKQKHFDRLYKTAIARRYGLYWCARQFKALFNELPPGDWYSIQAKHSEFRRLQRVQKARGLKPGFAAVMFKQTFGHWPDRKWQWKTDQPWLQR